MSRDAVAARLTQHTATATSSCPSLASKHVTPHVLRHTAGIDTTVIALWLGHESIETTQVYLHADMTMKENAVARTNRNPTRTLQATRRRLMTFLQNL